ncbi:MAG: hypothetical protein FJ213_02085 [Ignavibacteria bacterium]|nr:hypothetical protein [Ignavibacteria bacterium]
MALAYYFDVHIPRAIKNGLLLKGIDVLTSQDDDTSLLSDFEILKRATEKNRVMVSFDDDLLSIAANLISKGDKFGGLIYAHPMRITIGKCVKDLELIALSLLPDEMKNQIIFLPLKSDV